jgi:hypothetical protein
MFANYYGKFVRLIAVIAACRSYGAEKTHYAIDYKHFTPYGRSLTGLMEHSRLV